MSVCESMHAFTSVCLQACALITQDFMWLICNLSPLNSRSGNCGGSPVHSLYSTALFFPSDHQNKPVWLLYILTLYQSLTSIVVRNEQSCRFFLFLLHSFLTMQSYIWWDLSKLWGLKKWFSTVFSYAHFFKTILCWLKFKKGPQIASNFIVKSCWYTGFSPQKVKLDIVSITPYLIFMAALLCAAVKQLLQMPQHWKSLLSYFKAWSLNELQKKHWDCQVALLLLDSLQVMTVD